MTYLNTTEAGLQLGVHRDTVRSLIKREELDGFRVARQFRTTQAAVDAYKAKAKARSGVETCSPAAGSDEASVIERLAEVISAAPAWLFDRDVPAPEGMEALHGALAENYFLWVHPAGTEKSPTAEDARILAELMADANSAAPKEPLALAPEVA